MVILMSRSIVELRQLEQQKREIDDFVAKATVEQLRSMRDWGGVQFELAEYAIRCCNERLTEQGEEI